MKSTFILLLALGACSTNDPSPIVGTYQFTSVRFEGQFTVASDGTGTATFTVDGVEYTAINSQLREGTSITMYSEDGAYVGLHQIDLPVSKYQEFRRGGLPSPFENQKRSESLLLIP